MSYWCLRNRSLIVVKYLKYFENYMFYMLFNFDELEGVRKFIINIIYLVDICLEM